MATPEVHGLAPTPLYQYLTDRLTVLHNRVMSTQTTTPTPTITHRASKRIGRVDMQNVRNVEEVTIDLDGDPTVGYVLVTGQVARPCWKCSTEAQPGTIRHYSGIYGGACFACHGSGFTSVVDTLDKFAKRERANLRARDRRAAKRAAEAAARAEEFAAKAVVREAEEAAHEAAEQARLDAQTYLGDEGEKVTFTGTVKVAMAVDGYAYGSTQMFLVIVGDEFTVKTYTSARWAYDVERGQQVTVTATVRKHEVRDGEKVTVVKAPRLVK